jgi:hypothetical protein
VRRANSRSATPNPDIAASIDGDFNISDVAVELCPARAKNVLNTDTLERRASITTARHRTPYRPAAGNTIRRIGLVLSGGGARAAVFHTGVLKRLAEEIYWKKCRPSPRFRAEA